MSQNPIAKDSFDAGVIAALHCLKTALQASPGFNNDVLVHCLKTLINNPSSQVDHAEFIAPLLALLHDHIIDENGTVTTKAISLD